MQRIILLGAMALLAQTARAQLLDVPDKKSSTVVIALPNTTVADAYRLCANVLQDEGWQLENTDAALLTIATDWKKMKGFIVRDWQANVSVRDEPGGGAQVYLRAKIRQDVKQTNQIFGVVSAENYDYSQLEKRTNVGKDWEGLMRVASLIGADFKYK